MKLEGIVSRFMRMYNGVQNELRLTQLGSLAVAQVSPPNCDVARAGRRFMGGNQIIANGVAPVTAIPTTTATLALYNAEADGGKSLVVDYLTFWLGSGTPTAGATLFISVSPSKVATVPSSMATGYGLANCSGSAIASKARFATAVTFPSSPAAPAWFAARSNMQLAAANVGQGDSAYIANGGVVVPPGYALGFGILSGTGTTPLYGISCMWDELELDLE